MNAFASLNGLQIGIAMGAASMISIGPNNIMLMREGLVGGRSGLVAALVWTSYGVLITVAILIAATSLTIHHAWQAVLCWTGLAALCWFALQAFRTAFADRAGADLSATSETFRDCLLRVLRIVWLNPLTYVELLLIPAAIGQSMAGNGDRFEFATSLLVTSGLCCFGYAYGGGLLARLMRSQRGIRAFDFASGVILTLVSVSLMTNLVSGNL